MSNALYYRARAALLLEMAAQMSDPSSEHELLNAADKYLRQAEQLELEQASPQE